MWRAQVGQTTGGLEGEKNEEKSMKLCRRTTPPESCHDRHGEREDKTDNQRFTKKRKLDRTGEEQEEQWVH